MYLQMNSSAGIFEHRFNELGDKVDGGFCAV